MIKYSIIIPTYNGSEKLDKCLSHISGLKKTVNDFEVLVIDNGSTDDTLKIAQSYKFVKYIYDSTPGLHVGRHLGAKKSSGEILCYLDDDSFVTKEWLLGIEETFKNPEVILAGGNNLPLYEAKPPKWLEYFWQYNGYGKFMGQLSLIKLNNKEMRVPAWFVFGCNFIIRKSALYKYGGFNPDGMPKDFLHLRGDGETALSCKLNEAGIPAYFNPKITIKHLVPASRMTREYFEKRAFAQGISDSYSKIRNEYYNYYNFDPKNVDEFKVPYYKRKYRKIMMKHSPKEYHEMCEYAKIAYDNGYNFHQNAYMNMPELKEWILKENYYIGM